MRVRVCTMCVQVRPKIHTRQFPCSFRIFTGYLWDIRSMKVTYLVETQVRRILLQKIFLLILDFSKMDLFTVNVHRFRCRFRQLKIILKLIALASKIHNGFKGFLKKYFDIPSFLRVMFDIIMKACDCVIKLFCMIN